MTGGKLGRSESSERNKQPRGQAKVSGAANDGSRRMLLIALGACLSVIAAGVAAAIFASSGGSPAGHVAGPGNSPAAASSPAAQPTALPTSTVKPQASGNRLAKYVLRWPPRLSRQIRRWEAGPGGKALAGVEEQMGTAMQTAGLRIYPSMKQSCMLLASEIRKAQVGPPVPDAAMQRLYANALAGLLIAAADCRAAISVTVADESTDTHLNKPLLNRSRTELATMSKRLYTAIGSIEALRD